MKKMRQIEDSTHSMTFQCTHVFKPEINDSKGSPKIESSFATGSVIGRNTIHGNRSTSNMTEYTDVLPFHNTKAPKQ